MPTGCTTTCATRWARSSTPTCSRRVRSTKACCGCTPRSSSRPAQDRFVAQNAFFTSSRLGVPGYRLQASDVTFEDNQHPVVDPLPASRCRSGHRRAAGRARAVGHGRNNVLYIDDCRSSTGRARHRPERAAYYIRRVEFKQDSVFGTQFLTDWNMYQLLGIQSRRPGTDWDLSLDYLSHARLRPRHHLQLPPRRLLRYPGPLGGLVDFCGIHDRARQPGRRPLARARPTCDYRYRFLWQHRQQLPDDCQLTAEVGKISDRNFLEEYFKQEWDELKDQSTDVELKRLHDNMSLSLFGRAAARRLLHRDPVAAAGGPFLAGPVAVRRQSHLVRAFQRRLRPVPHGRRRRTRPPATRPFSHLPWEARTGRAAGWSRGKSSTCPCSSARSKSCPMPWANWATGAKTSTATPSTGPTTRRASGPAAHVERRSHRGERPVERPRPGPQGRVRRRILCTPQANQHLTDLPLYDPLDDNSIEAFRRRFVDQHVRLAGRPCRRARPAQPLRSSTSAFTPCGRGLGDWVTSPSMEIADDLDGRPRWASTSAGRPSAARPTTATSSTGSTLDTDVTLLPRSRPRQLRQRGRAGGLRFPLARGRPADAAFRRHLRLLRPGAEDRQRGRLPHPAAARRPVRGLPLMDGPIHSEVVIHVLQLLDEPEVDLLDWASRPIWATPNFGEFIRHHPRRRIAAGQRRLQRRSRRATRSARLMVEPRFLPKGQLGNFAGFTFRPPARWDWNRRQP